MVNQANRDPLLAELREQTKWLRLLGLRALRPLVEQILVTEKQKLVYEYSDGKRSVREVARLAGVGNSTISRMWSTWIAAGICIESQTASGRAQHLASLSQLGMDIPVQTNANATQGFEEDEGVLKIHEQ